MWTTLPILPLPYLSGCQCEEVEIMTSCRYVGREHVCGCEVVFLPSILPLPCLSLPSWSTWQSARCSAPTPSAKSSLQCWPRDLYIQAVAASIALTGRYALPPMHVLIAFTLHNTYGVIYWQLTRPAPAYPEWQCTRYLCCTPGTKAESTVLKYHVFDCTIPPQTAARVFQVLKCYT